MPIKRIDSKRCSSRGWQAWVYTRAPRYLSRYFADASHGGPVASLDLAKQALPGLQREAARLRRAG